MYVSIVSGFPLAATSIVLNTSSVVGAPTGIVVDLPRCVTFASTPTDISVPLATDELTATSAVDVCGLLGVLSVLIPNIA